ncbi:MAG TPA: hypothetical protein DDW76_06635 [Cyanobacteria bacterium UBA11369]|nr:hypothetical protein [Cyanobacteria bacterium UBA11371]HBE36275.1 hypothetical protein [Cyanobacteria bacterium UBA11368]HBE48477.1 hypothetical protein [Cyanobacteria bacterium UBA11369]
MSKIGTKRKGKKASSLQLAHQLQLKSLLSQTGDTLDSHSRVGDTLPTILDEWEILRVMVIGSHRGVTSTIHLLHVLGFAQVGDWSRLLPAPNSSEVMSILTRRIKREMPSVR